VVPWSAAARRFEAPALAHLATLSKDGSPRSTPVWVDREGETDLVFFTLSSSVKVRQIAADPRVALSIVSPDNPLDHATVYGQVVRQVDGEAGMAIVDRISHKYTGQPYDLRDGLVAMVVRPTGWAAHDASEY